MEYISTRNTDKNFSFRDVFLKGLAPDGGLFVPKKIPIYNDSKLNELKKLSYNQLAAKIILDFCGNEFNEDELIGLIDSSYKNFRVKNVISIKKLRNINLLELFHGPTLAFKDIAMQVIGNMYDIILKKNNSKINIVVATSGDTGAAAIDAMKNKKNIKIFVLHPYKKISEIQRKFMTTVDSNNVFNLAINGNFDECQKFVKLMFSDKDFSSTINMSGVNSINWSRIIIQVVYYFFSYFQVAQNNEKINFSVPTGNFGDIYAGYVAKKMGLPINKLIIATNNNDILKRAIKTGQYKPLEVIETISPSMDIQVASNFERLIFDVCSNDPVITLKLMDDLNKNGMFVIEKNILQKIKESFCSESLSEEETKNVINKVYKDEGILIDPHTAIAVGVINKLSLEGKTVALSTAHPAKFSEAVMKETNIQPILPESLQHVLSKKEKYEKFSKDISEIKNYILKKI